MTALLQQAFERASSLPEKEQDRFAQFLIAEIDDEKQWEPSFAASQNELAHMAREALAEYRAGKTSLNKFTYPCRSTPSALASTGGRSVWWREIT